MHPRHGGNLTWAASLAGCPPENLLDFSASINPLGPPVTAIAAIQSRLSSLRAYPDPDYTSLCSRLGQLHQLEREWILPGNGTAELLTWVGRDLADLDAVVVFTPAFADYDRAISSFGGQICPCPFRLSLIDRQLQISDYGQLLHRVLDQVAGDRTGLLLNNPHNPTGQMLAAELLLPYLKCLPLVVVDEAYMDFLPPAQQESLIPLVQQYPNLVVLRSLTKFYSLPGLRLGYAVGHPDRLHRWQKWRDPWPVNALAIAAAEAVLADDQFNQQTWAWLPSARQQLWQGLSALEGLAPLMGAANFLLVHAATSVPQLQKELLQKYQILIRDCLSFAELGDRYFRVAVRREAENQQLLASLAQLL